MFKKLLSPVYFLILWIFIIIPVCFAQQITTEKVGPQSDGSMVVPTHQRLRPAGLQITLPGRPVDLALSPNGKLLALKNWRSIDLIRISDRVIMQSLAFPKSGAAVTGICWSADGHKIYATEAEDRVRVAELDGSNIMHWNESFLVPKFDENVVVKNRTDTGEIISGDPAPTGLTLSPDEKQLYVTLSRYNLLAIIDVPGGRVRTIPVGMAPYNVILGENNKAYVANWGGRVPQKNEKTANSSGSQVLVDPNTGIANTGSISIVDLKKRTVTKSINVGLHPSGMVLSPDNQKLFVACANSDTIYVIDTLSEQVVETISTRMYPHLLFGSSPNAVTISNDGQTLYAANGTDNAICVIQLGKESGGEAKKTTIQGFIPTGWYPGSVILDRENKFLFIANIKGMGSRNQKTERAGYNSHDHLGSISIIPVPTEQQLKTLTQLTLENNQYTKAPAVQTNGTEKKVALPTNPGETSFFKHVIYIIKENKTYDQIFGDMPQGNGEPELVIFGRDVTPNHHKLAETFVLLDNFYCSGILSADGHQWTDEAFVTDYLEKSFGDWVRSYPYDGDDALAYAASGFIWDNVLKHGLTFRDYGEFVQAEITPNTATFSDIYDDYLNNTSKVKIRAKANLETLTPYLCETYTGFPNSIPDVYRAREFIKELDQFEKKNNLPNFIIMLLPNDHTSGTRPGRPTPEAAVADNDLALGQIVQAVSNSKFWPETCIFVTEDDPQNGLDHVDGHRTVGMVISPYTKRGQVISTYYTQISMVRTMENILGLPPMNQFDWAANPMTECFTNTPDFTPYTALPNIIPLNELNPPLQSLRGKALYWAQKSLQEDLSDLDRINEDTFNRIIWHAVKGYNTPYPEKAD